MKKLFAIIVFCSVISFGISYINQSNIMTLSSDIVEALSNDSEYESGVVIHGCYKFDDGTPTDFFGPCYKELPRCNSGNIGLPYEENNRTYYPCGSFNTVYSNCSIQGSCWDLVIVP